MSQYVESKQPHAKYTPALPATDANSKPLLPLIGVLLIGILWLTGMLWLVLTTSNPVTLNKEQILRANFVIQAKFIEKLKGFDIDQAWPPQPNLTSISQADIANLKEIKFEADVDYLVPITRTGDTYLVTPSRLPSGQPLIYPATAEALTQLKLILKEKSPE